MIRWHCSVWGHLDGRGLCSCMILNFFCIYFRLSVYSIFTTSKKMKIGVEDISMSSIGGAHDRYGNVLFCFVAVGGFEG